MAKEKRDRQKKLLEIIRDNCISTQDELTRALCDAGYETTQATISRDINELHIVKITMADGRQKYMCMNNETDIRTRRILTVFSQAVVDIKVAQNFLVLHTLPGMAGASALAIDALHLQDSLGCIAGDDTIFVASSDNEAARRLQRELENYCFEDRY